MGCWIDSALYVFMVDGVPMVSVDRIGWICHFEFGGREPNDSQTDMIHPYNINSIKRWLGIM